MRAVALCIVVASSVASASPAAEKLFQDGKKLLADGKLDEACDAFRRSNEIEARAGTLLNLGRCEEMRGRIATAWETYVRARTLAKQEGEPRSAERAAEADTKVAALAKKLPYLTVRAPESKPAGLVVKRDGNDVSAELDHEVPIDPGRYELEATAPGHVAWKQTAVVAIGQKAVIQLPALAVDQSTTSQTAITPAVVGNGPTTSPVDTGTAAPIALTASTGMLPDKSRVGFGAAVGGTTDGDLIFGVRIPLQLAAVGKGAIRALPTVFYAHIADIGGDPDHDIELVALGLGVEYVAPLGPKFFVAAGLGLGIDLFDDTYDDRLQKQGWGAARLSPTLRVGRSVDVGLHLQVVATDDNIVGLGELGVDYFFY